MRIFLDANILFSAANPSGSIRQLLTIARTAGHECWADEQVIREAHRNLFMKQRERIPDLEHLLGEIHFASKLPNVPFPPVAAPLPENDSRVLAAAIANECEAFVTGDQTHFGPLYGKVVSGVKIYSPRQLADTLMK
jgi:predicted nucleic acid-binding protein